MKFQCIKGGNRARWLALAGVPQRAFDLAQANTPADQACMLVTLHMPEHNNTPGGMLPLDEAERFGLSLVETVREIREEDRRSAVRESPGTPRRNATDAAVKPAKGHRNKQPKAKERACKNAVMNYNG